MRTTGASDRERREVARDLARLFCELHRRSGLMPAEYVSLVRETLEQAAADAYSTRGRP